MKMTNGDITMKRQLMKKTINGRKKSKLKDKPVKPKDNEDNWIWTKLMTKKENTMKKILKILMSKHSGQPMIETIMKSNDNDVMANERKT